MIPGHDRVAWVVTAVVLSSVAAAAEPVRVRVAGIDGSMPKDVRVSARLVVLEGARQRN